MSKIVNASLALLAAGLLSTSALASSGTQDTSFLKKEKHHHVHVQKEEITEVKVVKDKYFGLEASYNFNNYKPNFTNTGSTSNSFDDSGSFGFQFGKIVNENLKLGLGPTYTLPRDYDFTSGSSTYHAQVKTTNVMVHGIYNFGAVSEMKVSPYISLAAGAAHNKTSVTTTGSAAGNQSLNHRDWRFAYQAGAGLSYKMHNDTNISLGYRFTDNGNAYAVSGVTTKRLQSNDIVLGVQIPF